MKSKNIFTLFLSLVTLVGVTQCDISGRYYQRIFPEFSVTSNIVYGNNLDYTGAAEDLTLDVYQPVDDNLAARPLVVMCHGGSFITGSKNGPDVVSFCQDMAKMGYVVASINYRLGFGIANLEGNATQAVMRGTQDLKAAIRFFRKSVAEQNNPYLIDANQIYAAGVSAGGFMTLHHAYLDQESEIPSFLDMNGIGLEGGLEGNSGNPGYSSQVNAIVNICGALGDSAWIQTNDEPACLFHGPNDQTVPYGSTTLNLFGFPVTEVDGSYSLNEKMNELGLQHCFEIYEGQDHVPHLGSPAYYDTTLSIMTQFLAQQICDYNFNCEYNPIVTGITEINTSSLELFPNPVADQLHVRTRLNNYVIRIYNTSGMLLLQSENHNGMAVIPTGIFDAGIYFIEINNNDFHVTNRFIKK